MASHLLGGKLNVSLVQEALKKEFLNILQLCEGPKVTVWDEWLAGPVGMVAEYSLLKENDVIEFFPLKPGSLPSMNVKHYIFVARPKIELMDLIAEYVFSLKNKQNSNIEFHLVMVPRRSDLCEKHLSNRGVLGSVSIKEFPCYIVPFESDLMSMELHNDFREYNLEGDPTSLFYAAHALRVLQQMFGVFPRVFGKGQAAKHVWDVFSRLNSEDKSMEQRLPSVSTIDHVLLLDRNVDLTTLFTTQLTYEGLIDEIFNIKGQTLTMMGDKFQSSDEGFSIPEKKRIVLNSADELYSEIRDKNFGVVGACLSKKARIIKSEMDERHKEKTVQELKHFVSRLQQLLSSKQSLATHTTIAESIKEVTDSFDFSDTLECEEAMLHCIDNDRPSPYIEDLIAQKSPILKILRLMCLQCGTASGLKPKVLEYYKKELIQVYGIKTLITLNNLEKCGLLRVQNGPRTYLVLKKSLQLTEDVTMSLKEDSNFISNKYTPITIRLAEHIGKNKGWSGITDILGNIPGPTLDEYQTTRARLPIRRNSLSSESSSVDPGRTVLVVFLGGCTYSEISALRNLSTAEDSSVEYVILTTKLINGNTLIQSLMED